MGGKGMPIVEIGQKLRVPVHSCVMGNGVWHTRSDVPQVFFLPGVVKILQRMSIEFFRPRCPIYAPAEPATGTRPNVETHTCVTTALAAQNGHHRPVRSSKDSLKSLFIGTTGFSRVTWMGVQPKSEKLCRLHSPVYALVEVIRHGFVVELNSPGRGGLWKGMQLLDIERSLKG